jgi:methylenetetrahydrofolate--tRNA-(uracil-5-)-methyltransferase
LLSHVTGGGDAKTFQPMNVNFGLFPPPAEVPNKAGKLRPLKGVDRRRAMTARAAEDIVDWLPAVPSA